MTELIHNFQAGAFIDYASKFNLKDKEQFLSLFDSWADSKMFSEECKKIILRIVEEYYLLKAKEKELKEKRKSSKHKKEIPKSMDDIRQFKFDF